MDISEVSQQKGSPLANLAANGGAGYAAALVDAAEDSLSSGMAVLAQSIAEDGFKAGLSPKLEKKLRRVYVDALIAQGNFEEAEKSLALDGGSEMSDSIRLRKAMVYAATGRGNEALSESEKVDLSKLSKSDAAWYRLARAYAFFALSQIDKAIAELSEAEKHAVTSYMRADIDIAKNMFLLSETFSGELEDKEAFENSLKDKVYLYLGTPAGFQLAKQYAAFLFREGRSREAFELIDSQLGIQFAQDVDKDELRLIGAAMTPDPEKQAAVFREILRQTSSPGVADFALSMLGRRADAVDVSYSEFLATLLKDGAPSLRDRVMIEMSKLALRRRDSAEAVKIAARLIDEYPASRYKIDALRILAWSAFSSSPPEYRLAASYLSELSELETDRNRSLKMKVLAADCYYLNKDYLTAAKIYAELFSRVSENRGIVLQKGVESFLMTDDIDSAVSLLAMAYSNKNVEAESLWNSEWKIISKYEELGLRDKAVARIDAALSSPDSDDITILRMMWIKARINEERGDFAATLKIYDEMLAKVDNAKNLDRESAQTIASTTLLMKAGCLASMGKFSGEGGAFSVYGLLRKTYPSSSAARLSYLYEARSEASLGHLERALNLCVELAEADPKGPYAYSALFESAQYARRLGMDSDYRKAISALDRLCRDFPEDPRNFYARLHQAEILRLINAFGDARSLYNEIINKYQSHPEIYLAWLGLGDSMLAQTGRSSDAVAIFEKLYSLPGIPPAAQAEAAFKWGFALERAGRDREANELRWLTSSKLLSEGASGGSARYWIGRSLYSLARSLELSGKLRDARAAYELIVKYKLPSHTVAEQKLKTP